MTAVHVNRLIKRLEAGGLIRRAQRLVTILQPEALRRIAGFDDTYLHVDARHRVSPPRSADNAE